MEGYVPMKGDLVWLDDHYNKPNINYTIFPTTYTVIDIAYLKNDDILIKIKEEGSSYEGWFNINKVSNFYRSDFFDPILIEAITPPKIHFNIQDPILAEFLKADEEFHTSIKEIEKIL